MLCLQDGPRFIETLVAQEEALGRSREGRLPEELVPRRIKRLATRGVATTTPAALVAATLPRASARPRASGSPVDVHACARCTDAAYGPKPLLLALLVVTVVAEA